mmetsp:Transcript_10039/g.46004  ORF Transcript_10039/g.46004 Transcript_10039/m.46004 type:complete len:207 (+) Transcript_10039:226-846(+)
MPGPTRAATHPRFTRNTGTGSKRKSASRGNVHWKIDASTSGPIPRAKRTTISSTTSDCTTVPSDPPIRRVRTSRRRSSSCCSARCSRTSRNTSSVPRYRTSRGGLRCRKMSRAPLCCRLATEPQTSSRKSRRCTTRARREYRSVSGRRSEPVFSSRARCFPSSHSRRPRGRTRRGRDPPTLMAAPTLRKRASRMKASVEGPARVSS